VIPMEVLGSKEKKMSLHKAAAEEKKEYEQEFDNAIICRMERAVACQANRDLGR
jgi:predicted ATP-binding protein involved in virulence